MEINGKKIIDKLKGEKRETELVSYRIDVEIKGTFTKICNEQGISAAKVVEELMLAFIKTMPSKGKR